MLITKVKAFEEYIQEEKFNNKYSIQEISICNDNCLSDDDMQKYLNVENYPKDFYGQSPIIVWWVNGANKKNKKVLLEYKNHRGIIIMEAKDSTNPDNRFLEEEDFTYFYS